MRGEYRRHATCTNTTHLREARCVCAPRPRLRPSRASRRRPALCHAQAGPPQRAWRRGSRSPTRPPRRCPRCCRRAAARAALGLLRRRGRGCVLVDGGLERGVEDGRRVLQLPQLAVQLRHLRRQYTHDAGRLRQRSSPRALGRRPGNGPRCKRRYSLVCAVPRHGRSWHRAGRATLPWRAVQFVDSPDGAERIAPPAPPTPRFAPAPCPPI